MKQKRIILQVEFMRPKGATVQACKDYVESAVKIESGWRMPMFGLDISSVKVKGVRKVKS